MESLTILRKAFKSGITQNIDYRKKQLKSVFKMLTDHEQDFCSVLKKDLNKSETESKMTELLIVKQEISYLLKNMDAWTAPEKVSKTFLTLTDAVHIQRQPFGVALCIGAWNYPVQLVLLPVVGLLAAGNCVLVKPSELATATERLLSELLPRYLDQETCRVELGDGPRTQQILQQRFDLIVYTGGISVGRIVMQAAAQFVTPVVLELGGKSPTYLDKSVDLRMAVKRLIWGKFINAGQTCVAPDYLLCHKDVKSEFLEMAVQVIEEFYSQTPLTSADYPRIINDRHYKRLMDLLETTKGKVITGGKGKPDERFVEPTIVVLDSAEDVLMKDELFGPILPILTVNSPEEAIEFINDLEKPLGLYVFTSNKTIWQKFEKETTSGSLLFNDVVVHCGVMGLPFGGVGNSGVGTYHGKYSIDNFSHKRGIMNRDTKEIVNNLFRYPPFTPAKLSWTEWGLKSDSSDRNHYCCIM